MGLLTGWRLCPRCGAALTNDGDKVECAACGLVHYANPAPAVSAFVFDGGGRVLLARRAHDPQAGLWDTPGGFLDEGEDPHDGLRRELREEAGVEIEVGDLRRLYVDAYGEGADARALLVLLYDASIVAGELEAADDVAELRWFAPDELPPEEKIAFSGIAPALREWAEQSERRNDP